MWDLKPISIEAIPAALAKAERYRLLNEPAEAASICQDILAVAPDNRDALVQGILATSDQGAQPQAIRSARRFLPRLTNEYDRAYFAGIISERLARAYWKSAAPNSCYDAYDCFVEAMMLYEKAETMRPPGNDDALLRWNACARALNAHAELRPRPMEVYEPALDD